MYDYLDRIRGFHVVEEASEPVALEALPPPPPPPPDVPRRSISSMRKYIAQLCAYKGIGEDEFYGRKRKRRVVQVRNEASYACRYSGASWTLIAQVMKCDHTTALHRASVHAIDNNLEPLTFYNADEYRANARKRNSKCL
jgi:hypothetical protein